MLCCTALRVSWFDVYRVTKGLFIPSLSHAVCEYVGACTGSHPIPVCSKALESGGVAGGGVTWRHGQRV